MHEQPPFGLFLTRLLRRVAADSVHLSLARGEAATILSARVNSRQVIVRPRSLHDPTDALPYGSLRPERIYAMSEFPNPPPFQGRVVRTSGEDIDGALTILRQDEDFSPQDGALLSALVPHLAIALRNYAAVERDRLHRSIGDRALERLGRGWLALTPGGRIVAADDLAERTLREGGQLRRSVENRLLATSPAANQRLIGVIEAAAADPAAPPHAVRIAEEPRLELLIAPLPVDEAEIPFIGAAVAAHLQVAPPDAEEPAAALGELFELPPAIARFAWTLARTGGIAESAEQLGLTVETARFYSKTLYAKLGVKGQAELAHRILTSAAALA